MHCNIEWYLFQKLQALKTISLSTSATVCPRSMWPISCSKLLHKVGHYFLDIQYTCINAQFYLLIHLTLAFFLSLALFMDNLSLFHTCVKNKQFDVFNRFFRFILAIPTIHFNLNKQSNICFFFFFLYLPLPIMTYVHYNLNFIFISCTYTIQVVFKYFYGEKEVSHQCYSINPKSMLFSMNTKQMHLRRQKTNLTRDQFIS